MKEEEPLDSKGLFFYACMRGTQRMKTFAYSVVAFSALLVLADPVTSLVADVLGDVITASAFVIAWVIVGSAIAWLIGSASDLGQAPDRRDWR